MDILILSKHKDRRNSCGLLREIHALEKCTQRLAEAIDVAPVSLTSEREAEVREAATEDDSWGPPVCE